MECHALFPHVQRKLDEEPMEDSDAPSWYCLVMDVVNYMTEIEHYTSCGETLMKATSIREKMLPGLIHAAIYEAKVLLSLAFHQGRVKEAELGFRMCSKPTEVY